MKKSLQQEDCDHGPKDANQNAGKKELHNNFNQIMDYALKLMRKDDIHISAMRHAYEKQKRGESLNEPYESVFERLHTHSPSGEQKKVRIRGRSV